MGGGGIALCIFLPLRFSASTALTPKWETYGIRLPMLIPVALIAHFPEGISQGLADFQLLERFFPDLLFQRILPLSTDIAVPLGHHFVHLVDTRNKVLYQLLLLYSSGLAPKAPRMVMKTLLIFFLVLFGPAGP